MDISSNREIARAQKFGTDIPHDDSATNGGKKAKKANKSSSEPLKLTREQQINASVNAYLKLSDEQRSNWEIVKNIAAATRPYFEHRSCPDGRVYLGEVIVLPPEESVKVKTFKVNDKEGGRIGFNRDTNASKMKQIMRRLLTKSPTTTHLTGCKTTAVYTFAPPFLARVFNPKLKSWELYDIDGQHRRHSCIVAGSPIRAFIVDMDLETARYNFILHNTVQTRVDRKTLRKGSMNPTATVMRALADTYGASDNQVDRLICGLKNGGNVSGINLTDKDAYLHESVVERAHVILRVWSKNKRWKAMTSTPSKEGMTSSDVFSYAGVLQAIGWVIKGRPNMAVKELESRLVTISNNPKFWYPSSKTNDICGATQDKIRDLYNEFEKAWKSLD